MEAERKGITVAGSLIADTFYKIDTYPEQGFLTNIRESKEYAGGTGNLIMDLAKLDPKLPVHVSAVIGEDEKGDMLQKTLGAFPNIDLKNVTRLGESSETLVMNAQDTKQRTFFFKPASSDIFSEEYVDWELADAKIFHLEYLLSLAAADAYDPEFGTHGARILYDARKRGMKTSIDIVSEQSSRARDIVTAALKYTDYCAINELEAEAVTGIQIVKDGRIDGGKAKEALVELAKKGVTVWAVIHSPECGYGYDCRTKEFAEVPSLKLPSGYIKGTNGAGDAYCCGILYGAYKGKSLAEAMRLGRSCAACSLSEENGTDGMRTYEEVKKLEAELEEYKRK